MTVKNSTVKKIDCKICYSQLILNIGPVAGTSSTGQEFRNVWNILKFDAEERSAFLDESLDGFVLSDDAASAGAGAEDGTL